MSTPRAGHAVVLGGGIAGLGAAIALAPHAERVTVLERDAYSAEASPRACAPQGEHAHILLASGLQSLSRLVPELPAWMEAAGLPSGDLTQQTRVAYDGAWLPSVPSGVPVRVATRGDVEAVLLRKVRETKNVELRTGVRAHRLLGTAKRVTGVSVFAGGQNEALSADLVVDAMGRSTPLPGWLRDWGLVAREESVDAGVTYASAWFEGPELKDDWTVLATLPVIPREPSLAVVVRYGPRRLLVSAVSYGRKEVPKTPEALLAFMEGLRVPQLGVVVRASRPASNVAVFGNTANRWRHYGELAAWPLGLVALGDAVCGLNPRYAQGMTTSALSVELLAEVAASAGAGPELGRRFQGRLEALLRVPWRMAMLEDRAWVALHEGRRLGAVARLVSWATQRVLRRAFTDVGTYIRFMRVAQLLDSPLRMLGPGLRAVLTSGAGSAVTEPPRVMSLTS